MDPNTFTSVFVCMKCFLVQWWWWWWIPQIFIQMELRIRFRVQRTISRKVSVCTASPQPYHLWRVAQATWFFICFIVGDVHEMSWDSRSPPVEKKDPRLCPRSNAKTTLNHNCYANHSILLPLYWYYNHGIVWHKKTNINIFVQLLSICTQFSFSFLSMKIFRYLHSNMQTSVFCFIFKIFNSVTIATSFRTEKRV